MATMLADMYLGPVGISGCSAGPRGWRARAHYTCNEH